MFVIIVISSQKMADDYQYNGDDDANYTDVASTPEYETWRPTWLRDKKYQLDKSMEQDNKETTSLMNTYQENKTVATMYGFNRHGVEDRICYLIQTNPDNQPCINSTNEPNSELTIMDFKQGLECNFISTALNYFEKMSLFIPCKPYIYIICQEDKEKYVASRLRYYYKHLHIDTKIITNKKEVTAAHPLGKIVNSCVMVSFHNDDHKKLVIKQLLDIIECNRTLQYQDPNIYQEWLYIIDIREYDIPYHIQAMMTIKLLVGKWYKVSADNNGIITKIAECNEYIQNPKLTIMTFDIETMKEPLQFPRSEEDEIMMISVIINDFGILIINESVVTSSKLPLLIDYKNQTQHQYRMSFNVSKKMTEKDLLNEFFNIMLHHKPEIIVTYNGDGFDWDYINNRARINGIKMEKLTGFTNDNDKNHYICRCVFNADCLFWAQRHYDKDKGGRGLKDVTRKVLGYEPEEVDPEEMVQLAFKDPITMAMYASSDAVATHFLYKDHIHELIFSLCEIVPTTPHYVLRQTLVNLCELYLTYRSICNKTLIPNKQKVQVGEIGHNGFMLDSSSINTGFEITYKSGVFRTDFSYDIQTKNSVIEQLKSKLDTVLDKNKKTNKYSTLQLTKFKSKIVEALHLMTELNDQGQKNNKINIFKCKISNMYAQIMISDNIVPMSILTADEKKFQDNNCALPCNTCPKYYESKEMECQRKTTYNVIEKTLTNCDKTVVKEATKKLNFQTFTITNTNNDVEQEKEIEKKVKYNKLPPHRQQQILRNSIVNASKNRDNIPGNYTTSSNVTNTAVICRATNRSFVKILNELYNSTNEAEQALTKSIYPCILNPLSRWHNLAMCSIIGNKANELIATAIEFINTIGITLTVSNESIWFIVPHNFPNVITINEDSISESISYLQLMLNNAINKDCQKFELTLTQIHHGFYIPAFDGARQVTRNRHVSMDTTDFNKAEWLGIDISKRNELPYIKEFKTNVIQTLLTKGTTIDECYNKAVIYYEKIDKILSADNCNFFNKKITDALREDTRLARKITEYDETKVRQPWLTAAKRLTEIKDQQIFDHSGTTNKFIIAQNFTNQIQQLHQRAIPIEIFNEEYVMQLNDCLEKWLHFSINNDDTTTENKKLMTVREIADWDYYRKRLRDTMSKLVIDTAYCQKIKLHNAPIEPTKWLVNHLKRTKENNFVQKAMILHDIEDIFRVPCQNRQCD